MCLLARNRVEDTQSRGWETHRQIRDVQASERVHRASIPAEREKLRVFLHHSLEIGLEVHSIVWIAHGARVPVLGDALVARRINQAIFRPAYCVERLQRAPIEKSLRVGSGLVGQHTEDEGVGN